MKDKYALVRVQMHAASHGYLKEVWRWDSWASYMENLQKLPRRITPTWELIAEGEDIDELHALGNLVEGSWVSNYARQTEK